MRYRNALLLPLLAAAALLAACADVTAPKPNHDVCGGGGSISWEKC